MLEILPVGTCCGHSPAPHCPKAGPRPHAETCGALHCQAVGCACPGVGSVLCKILLQKRWRALPPTSSSQKSRRQTCFSGKELKPLSLFVNACRGIVLWLEVRGVFTQVHQSICPLTWWCIYNSLISEVSRGVKSRCMCEEVAEDQGTGVYGMACPALQFQCRLYTPDSRSSTVPSSERRTKPHSRFQNQNNKICNRKRRTVYNGVCLSASHKDSAAPQLFLSIF